MRDARAAESGISRAAAADTGAEAVKAALKQKQAEYEKKRKAARGKADITDLPKLASLARCDFVGEDGLLQVPEPERGVRASVYAIFAPDEGALQYIGVSRSAQKSLRAHFARRPELAGTFVLYDIRKADRTLLEAIRQAWLQEGGAPPGNDGGAEQSAWEDPLDVRSQMSAEELEEFERLPATAADTALKDKALELEIARVEVFEARGCDEQLLFDAKLKARGLLDFDNNAPVGMRRPEGGVGAAFKVTLLSPDGEEMLIECPGDMTILEAAEEADVEMSSSCRSGACSACAGMLVEGIVDQSDQSYLDDKQVDAGYAMLCVCYPRSDVVVEIEKQDEIA